MNVFLATSPSGVLPETNSLTKTSKRSANLDENRMSKRDRPKPDTAGNISIRGEESSSVTVKEEKVVVKQEPVRIQVL